VNPAAGEACTGVDDARAGAVDEADDADGDGHVMQRCLDGDDCDDMDPAVHPGATEVANGTDDDCDGVVDDGTTAYDDDGDCWCEAATCAGSVSRSCAEVGGGDCDDEDPDVHPGAPETRNRVDDDCDGAIDDGTTVYDDDGDCWCEGPICTGSVSGSCTTPTSGDCDDADRAIHPGATETCNDSDDDCDGTVPADEVDADGDGFALCDDDCYDDNEDAWPEETDYYDEDRGDGSFDYDCDGQETQEYTATFSCSWGGSRCTHTDGWTTATPGCGESGTWATNCTRSGTSCTASGTSTRTQSCR
jgi:hypothetical protein